MSAQQDELERLEEELLFFASEEITVTATKHKQTVVEAPATVRIITAEQIKERGYFTLEEALSDLPGTQFRNIIGFNSYVFLRGVPSQNNLILVLVDGIQINELNSGGFYGGGQFNLFNVKRIEIVYGPASALYGTNAISGIINVITNDPKDIEEFHASILLGNFGTRNVDFRYGHYNQENDFGLSVSGMFKQSEKADLGGEKGDNNWTNEMENFEDDLSFDGKLTYKNFSLGLVFQDKQSSRTTNYRTVNNKYLDHGTRWHIRFINGYLKHYYDAYERWSLSSQLYFRNATVMDNTIAYIDTSAQVGYYRPNDLIGFESIIDYTPSEKLNLIGGIVVENENLAEGFSKTWSDSPDEKPPTPPKPNMENNSLQSLYLQIQFLLLESVQLTTGVRFDNSSVYDQVLTPRMSLVYNENRLTAKLLYTEAFRAPKPWDYNWGDKNPDLEPEWMKSVEVFLAYNILDDLRVEAAVYRNIVYDIF
ncbi:MAG: TonB-dependent receptor plug domain-containing protein [Candidatus Marinimicrobia bacterium]|nr:TonB-dependent receptor plug domain-containing protein [Candidatus Neomarinimicrobiota bacterium]